MPNAVHYRTAQAIITVVDGYGGVAGPVTLEDLIETVLDAEIVDEADRVVDVQERVRQLGRKYSGS